MTKFAWRVSRWQPTGAWRVLCLRSVRYDEFRKRPKNWATAAPWVKSDQKWHFCWNLHEFQDVRSSFFLNTSSQTILDVKIVKILTLRGDRERQIYYLTRAFFNVFWRKNDRNPYLTRRFRGPKLLPYTRKSSKSLSYAATVSAKFTTLRELFRCRPTWRKNR